MIGGFITKNSTYYIDETNRTIWGGILGDKKYIYDPMTEFFIGQRAVVMFVDEYGNPLYDRKGNRKGIQTGVIQGYI